MVLVSTIFIFFNLVYLIALWKKDFSVIDVAWSLSFIVIFFTGLVEYNTSGFKFINIIGLLVILWGLRLASYLFYRWLQKGKEDFRYANWRKEWGDKANVIAYFKVFLLQAVLSILIA